MGQIYFETSDFKIAEIQLAFSNSRVIREIIQEGVENDIYIRGGKAERSRTFQIMTTSEICHEILRKNILSKMENKYGVNFTIQPTSHRETVIYVRYDIRERDITTAIKICKILVCAIENKIKSEE